MSQESVNLAARGQVTERISGRFFAVISATTKFTVEINGRRREVRAGSKISSEPFRRISFIETQGVANSIVYDAGDEEFQGEAVVTASNAQTYAYGNLGVAVSAAAAGGLPACDASGFLQITNGMALSLPGTNAGNRRQIVTFSMSTSSPANLNIMDLNSKVFMTLASGDKISLSTDAGFILSGAGGRADCTIGEIYLSS